MNNYDAIIEGMKAEVGEAFEPASKADLARLRSLKLPKASMEFYRRFAPVQTLWNSQSVLLRSIADVVEANTKYGPGCYTAAHGYIVFATNPAGDAYAYDVHHLDADGEPRIVLLCHEVIDKTSTAEEVRKLSKPVATCLAEFLHQFLRGEVDEKCIYFPD